MVDDGLLAIASVGAVTALESLVLEVTTNMILQAVLPVCLVGAHLTGKPFALTTGVGQDVLDYGCGPGSFVHAKIAMKDGFLVLASGFWYYSRQKVRSNMFPQGFIPLAGEVANRAMDEQVFSGIVDTL